MSLKNTLLESSSQKTRSLIFPCPYSRASSSQVQLHLDTRFLGNSNSPLIRTKSDSLGFTSYIYCKFNFENPKPRSQQCFVAPFLCISPVIPVTASDFMLCLSEIQSPNALRASIFSSCAVPYWRVFSGIQLPHDRLILKFQYKNVIHQLLINWQLLPWHQMEKFKKAVILDSNFRDFDQF